MRWILIKTKYKQKMQIILQYKKLWGKLEIINIIKANVGKYTKKGRNVKVSEAVKGQVKTEEVKGMIGVCQVWKLGTSLVFCGYRYYQKRDRGHEFSYPKYSDCQH